MPSQLHGIDAFIQRLEKIAEECGDKPPKDAESKDEFVRTKQRVYTLLDQVREDVHSRTTLLRQRGNCYESIQKGHSIRQNLEELKGCLSKLQELHKRTQGKRNSNLRKDELQARYKDIRVLKKLVDEAHELFMQSNSGAEGLQGSSGLGSSNPRAQLFGAGLRDLARASDEDARRLLSSEEEEALASMKRRDQELDQHVGQIGLVIERLNPLAQQIGATAQRQRERAEAMTDVVTKADQDMQALNKKITEVMRYERNTNCCCQLVLGIALLCCAGFVLQQLMPGRI